MAASLTYYNALLDALRRGHSERRPPSKGTVAKQRLHEQHRNPEDREFPAAACARKHPAIADMLERRADQDGQRQERNHARVCPENESDASADFASDHKIGESARIADALEITDRSRNGEGEDFEQEPVGQEENAKADAQEKGGVRSGSCVDHKSLR